MNLATNSQLDKSTDRQINKSTNQHYTAKSHNSSEATRATTTERAEIETTTTERIERCRRYGWEYRDTSRNDDGGDGSRGRKRRLFFGSLIADDSWHAILAHAAETKGLYHTAVFGKEKVTFLFFVLFLVNLSFYSLQTA